jgi:hypothetical protein
MSLTIAAFAPIVIGRYADGMWALWTVRVLPLLGGLLMAPWLAMRFRSTLAAVVAAGSFFSASLIVPIVVMSIVMVMPANIAHERLTRPWSMLMIASCVAAGILGARRFLALEDDGDAARSLTFPRVGTSSPRRFRPVAALAAKELHLQQLTVLLGMMFTFGSVGLLIAQRLIASLHAFPVALLVTVYSATLALVVGALASAEERQLGIADVQMLQPASSRTQWLIKIIVTISLSVVFAAVIPAIFSRMDANATEPMTFGMLTLLAVFLTSGGLYLSSLTNSVTAAMVASLPAGLALTTFLRLLQSDSLAVVGLAPARFIPFWPLVTVVIPLLLWLAHVNHRARERRTTIIVWQVAAIAAVIAVISLRA